ncbi:N-6 DNA methylase [Cyanobacterium aponinum FACHB-4101]|uniref:N-6 DNA methylase n=1 Tax=Cyanobacterium aponinum TaxID=379064 RepID=UPI001680D769|nr:N-6 DNA methylase [Cyanobacterium aponinum]MBD2394688.1 N-6 DNA methylase [Cyanobacterium aponinum FACHB-4101]
MKLNFILKDSNYKLSQFKQEEINDLENSIFLKETKKSSNYYIKCLVRNKDIQLKPEEAIRQLYLRVLNQRYGYPFSRMEVEYSVSFGREKKKADIVIFDCDRADVPYIIIELKKPKLKDGKEQLKSYCNATGAPIAVWTNGDQISYYQRKDPNYFEDITDIPNVNQTLADILNEKFTLEDLIKKDKLVNEKKSLKDLIEELEDEVLANAGVDVFEEVFKLIFAKLYDEWLSGQGKQKNSRCLEFRNTGQTETALKNKIQKLFDEAKNKWEGVFSEDSKITLTPSHLSVCVASLENVKLFNSNLDVVDEAFEYLINKSSKGEKGQFFTPRYVIDMCVKMLNPKEDEFMIDTAAGSSGFPVHTIFHVWKQILEDEGISANHLFSLEEKPYRCKKYVEDKVFAIDFDEKAVRVARTLNLIAGDGETNVLHLNTLDFERWEEAVKQEEWQDIYYEGFKRLRKLQTEKNSYQQFNFDVLMANPPFAGDIKESRLIQKYDLSVKDNGKRQTKMGRDILFIERNLDFLKPGGRMAIVLPQGRFNNSSDKYIRDYIAQRCRILAVIGLHGNTFKPHTGTKTSVLLVQKWDDKLCPKVEDYNIFFATMRKSGKDNSGEKIYRKTTLTPNPSLTEDVTLSPNPSPTGEGSFQLDSHGHLIVDHDLFNHDGVTEDGIAEAFIEFAKKEDLSFFDLSLSINSFDEVKYHSLMDRLEAVELTFKYINKNNISFRFDSEYFGKNYLNLVNILDNHNCLTINDFAFVTDGIHESIDFDEDSNILSFSAKYPKDNYFDLNDIKKISEKQHLLNPRTQFQLNDVIISTVGTIGNCAVVDKSILPANCDRDVGIIRINKPIIKPRFLSTFIVSKYGKFQSIRESTGNVQLHLFIYKIREIKVPNFNHNFQELIENIVIHSKNISDNSKQLYQEAEELLLTELGLKDWQPTEDNITVKSFSSSFINSGRLDAEYYQPKYDQLEKIFVENALYTKKIIDFRKDNHRGLQPIYQENGLLKVVNSRHILEKHLDYDNLETTSQQYWNLQEKARIYHHDILIYTTGANIGRTNIYLDNKQALASNHVNILRLKNENHIYVGFVLNSIIGRLQTEKLSAGSAQAELYPKDIDNFIIPFIKEENQQKIERLYIESFTYEKRSKQLLEIAKKGVEKAIESDEETAIKWINEELEKLGIEV